jgi:hypothetical protein
LSREFARISGVRVCLSGSGWLARDFDRLWADPIQREACCGSSKDGREPRSSAPAPHHGDRTQTGIDFLMVA